MGRYARGLWSDQEVLDALHGRSGTQEIRYRADVLRGGARDREVSLAPGSSITLNAEDAILRTGRFELYEAVDPLTEEIKPYMLLRMGDKVVDATIIVQTCAERDALDYTCAQWDALDMTCAEMDAGVISSGTRIKQFAEFPLGVFIPSTPARRSTGGLDVWSIEAYDRSIILAEDGLDEPLFIAAGTKYMDAVLSVLAGAGITNVMISDYVDTEIPADREFEVGKTKQEVCNTLLGEINFNPIFCDADGRFVIQAYQEPTAAAADITYRADALSIIGRDTTTETDYYKVPNVFIAVCSNPDLNEDYRSVYINDNPVSPLSTVRRGRRIISEIYRPDQIASQSDLDAYAKRMAFDRMLAASETVTFTTAPMPVHGRAEDVELQHPDASGVFRETGWTISLDSSGDMEHTVKRTVLM